MKILLIHLSDIHITDGENSILNKEEKLFEAFRNELFGYNKIFILITGDTAYSGRRSQYDIGNNLITELILKIKEYASIEVSCLVIAGNHDCDFTKDNKARQNQINFIQKLGESVIDESVIEQCASIQSDFFEFRDKIHDNDSVIYSDYLINIYGYSLGDKNIRFHCYNTAYISEIKEQAGKMYFPISQLKEPYFREKADLYISLFHHPYNWLNPINKREFATHINKTSDFYLTGHEHEFSQTQLADIEGNIVYHVEGSVLQESSDIYQSEFNLIGFDLEAESYFVQKYFWNEDRYEKPNNELTWTNYKRGKFKVGRKFNLQPSFSNYLEDVGGKFSHPYKSDIKLSDVFIYPKLRLFNSATSEETISIFLEDSESIIKNLKPKNKLLLFGAESIGKSSLIKMTYQVLYDKGYIPVLIKGQSIKSFNLTDFKKLVDKSFEEQYGNDEITEFSQEKLDNIFILIDDIDKNLLKTQKSKGRLIKALSDYYTNLILIGSELFTIEEIISDEQVEGEIYSGFTQYEFLEFNYSFREKLIQRWYLLGREDFYSDEEYWRKCDHANRSIELIMGQKIVPNYPFFILVLLQALESANPHDLQISSYGTYYQLLILKAFTDKIKEQSDITLYQNYCAELAYYFFNKKTKLIDETEHLTFHQSFISYEKYDLPSLSADKAVEILTNVGVINKFDDVIEFRYQYTYYYFLAQFLHQNITKKEVQELISKICKRLYNTELANIIMFLIHFSKDEFILDELLKNAQEVFSELAPCKLEDDIMHLQTLLTELPKLYLQSKSIEQYRTEESLDVDKQQEHEYLKEKHHEKEKWNLDDDTEIDTIAKINLAFKLVELMGQVLKNNYGAMLGSIKNKMLQETYLVGLRTLNIFFSVINDNSDFILQQLKQILANSKSKKEDEDKIEKTARHLLFGLCSQISYIFIKKVSDSIGTNKLADKYAKIQEEHNFSSVQLINFLIKLDHFSGFPNKELHKIKDHIERHPLSYYVLKRMVVNHLHRYPVTYQDRQRICQFLGISVESQLKIDADRRKAE